MLKAHLETEKQQWEQIVTHTWTPEEIREITSAGIVWYVHRLKKISVRSYRVQVMRVRRVKNTFQTEPPLKNKVWTTDLDIVEGDWIFRDSLGGDWTRLRGPKVSKKRKSSRMKEEAGSAKSERVSL